MRASDLAVATASILVVAGCDYKGPTSLKETVNALIDASLSAPAVSGDAQSPVKTSPACDLLQTENLHTETQALALQPTCPPRASIVPPLAMCRTTPSGDVGLKIAVMRLLPADARVNRCGIEARVDLVHLDHKNAEVSAPIGAAIPGDHDAINFADTNGWKWDRVGAPTFFDFDGDGDPEILLSGIDPGAATDAWQGADWHEAWTFRGGTWKKYPPLATTHFSAIEDVDHDGRPDLRTRGAYDAMRAVSGLAKSQERILQPMFVLHSLPHGTFSADDAVAKKAATDACSGAGALPFTKAGHALNAGDALTIACARIHRQSADAVMKQLSTTCKAYFDNVLDDAPDHCPAWAKQIATTTPSVTLP